MYAPGVVSEEPVQTELEAISRESANPSVLSITLNVTTVVPFNVFDGLTVYADGTLWNPGSGEGVYTYYNSTWNKLG